MRIGIVGLPNVGKSTLFNALTRQAALVRNVPFTTIEPNVGVVPVPDERLNQLASLSRSRKIVPTTIEFVDIAGLVKNAHKGEGLGNQFLANIREVDAIVHVIRFFGDPAIIHVANAINPLSDADTIITELALADLATAERAFDRAEDKIKAREKNADIRARALKKLKENLAQGIPTNRISFDDAELPFIHELSLLTSKAVLYIANVSDPETESGNSANLVRTFAEHYSPVIPLSVKIEQELVQLPDAERVALMKEYGMSISGLEQLIKASYDLLALITFFTSGEPETRAWTVRREATAPQAAGKIHSDFERGFIRAETVSYQDLIDAESYAIARSHGKVRDEGKEYVVQDGDVMLFKFST